MIAPDVRELKVRVSSLEKQMDLRFNAMEQKFDIKFDAMEQKNEAQFKAIMSAFAESKAQVELTNLRVITALSERVAVLEAQRH